MRINSLTPYPASLAELGRRLTQVRKQRGYSQQALADSAGIGVATLRRIEDGKDSKLGSWLRLLNALEMSGAIDGLLPENFRSPMVDAKGGTRRKSGPGAQPDFSWGDER